MRVLAALLLLCPAAALAAPSTWAAGVLAEALAANARGDDTRALSEFGRLAAHGSAIGETMLGAMAAQGRGQRRDPATAATWWLRAANRGYPPAQYALADALARGAGVAADAEGAWVWATLAATLGDPATATRARALADRLATRFDAARLAKLDRRRVAWRPWASLEE